MYIHPVYIHNLLYHGTKKLLMVRMWVDQRVLPWYSYNITQWQVVIPWLVSSYTMVARVVNAR